MWRNEVFTHKTCKILLLAKWWQMMTGLNIRDELHIHESILFGFHGRSDDAIVLNYCILYAKHYIYLENFKKIRTKIH